MKEQTWNGESEKKGIERGIRREKGTARNANDRRRAEEEGAREAMEVQKDINIYWIFPTNDQSS